MKVSRVFFSSELYRGLSPPIKDFPLPREGSIESKVDRPERNVRSRCFDGSDPPG
jgi:hypothetical protein